MRSWVTLLFAVSLLQSREARESKVTAAVVKEGEDLILHVDDEVPEDFYAVYWRFNNTVSLVGFSPGKEPKASSNFTGRVEFPGERFSVKLKNLQLADSGVYTAGVYTLDGDRRLHEYKVTVQAPVTPVKLSVVSRSSASCNLTVSCSTACDSHIISSTFTCADGACGQEGGGRSEVTTPGLLNGSIVCHHSNQVNWTQASEGIRHVCSQYAAGSRVPGTAAGVSVLLLLLLLFLLLGLFLYCRKRKNYKRESVVGTVYDIPLAPTGPRLQDPSPTDEASGLSPTSTYSLVGAHTGPLDPRKARGPARVESPYARVEKTPRSVNN